MPSLQTLREERYPGYRSSRKVPEHHYAVPDDKPVQKQGTLDGFATQTRIPAFTAHGLLDYICELIVTEDGDRSAGFSLQYCRPSFADKDIPHRTMVRDEIEDRARLAITRVREKLRDVPGLISFTFDTWTSETGAPYLGVTGHYIDAPKKIRRLGWFTADNATNTDTALVSLTEELNAEDDDDTPPWDPVEHRVRCMEHAVHLGAGHFISDVSPMSAKAVLAKVKKMKAKLCKENPDLDLDELDALLEQDDSGDEEDYGDDEGTRKSQPVMLWSHSDYRVQAQSTLDHPVVEVVGKELRAPPGASTQYDSGTTPITSTLLGNVGPHPAEVRVERDIREIPEQ
ncbi:hypothetical protein B0H13DRAFT_1887120 [Mycena leptocephala]|nr:hypothetical protein B0H13DRAFT_1887120 [Mycena leptocephala]